MWTTQSTADPTGTGVAFNGVACAADGSCIAVGTYGATGTASPSDVAFAERFSAGSWSLQSVPLAASAGSGSNSSALFGVSCGSPAACVAVGYEGPGSAFVPLVERFNGSGWSRLPAVSPNVRESELTAVSCPSANVCVAAGRLVRRRGGERPLVELWNGAAWAIQTLPRSRAVTHINAVSCATPTSCTAVGAQGVTTPTETILAEHWNGHRWRLQSVPTPHMRFAELDGVSCPSTRRCVAVGHGMLVGQAVRQITERWNGSRWSLDQLPGFARAHNYGLTSVSCTGPRKCLAVGTDLHGFTGPSDTSPLAESLTSGGWTIERPVPARRASFTGVSCVAALSQCTAVGSTAGGALAESAS